MAAAAADHTSVELPESLADGLRYGALILVDAELRIVMANGPAFAGLGSRPAPVRGRRIDEVVDPTLLGALLPNVRAALTGEERTIELTGYSATACQRLTVMPWRRRGARVDGALVFFWDTAAVSLSAAAAEAEGRYRLLAESATDVVSLRDRDGVYRYVSPSALTLSGYTPAELVGRRAAELVHPDDREAALAAIARLLGGEPVVEFEYRVLRRDGSLVWVHTAARALHDPRTGEVTEVRTSTHDITERRAREEQLRATTGELRRRLRETAAIATLGERALEESDLERFLADAAAMTAETLGVPLCAVLVEEPRRGLRVRGGSGWDPGTVGHVILTAAQPDGWLQRLGQAPVASTELPPDPGWRRLLREHGVRSSMWVLLGDRERPLGVLSVHERDERAFTDDDRTFLVAVGSVLRDAIARHRAEATARHDALHDPLTGLPNRRLLTDRLGHALARSARSGERHAVLFLDVDRFKLVNDSLGHEAGDRLLRLLGPRLREAVRDDDTVARFGGDEFVVLCENVSDEREAATIARRLTAAIAQPFDLGGREHVASASIGVAVTRGTQSTPEEVLRDADTAMYRAKDGGRSRFELFDSGMRQRTLARLELEDELRRALDEKQLAVHYQPIHAIDREVPVLVEALVRWQHPERGMLAPDTFIAVAEETSLIVPLGEQVLRTACTDVARWRAELPAASDLGLSVNVSARQITRPTFDAEVRRILTETGMPAHALCLEITEGVLLQDSLATAATIAKLRDRGIRMVLDDFGTGYSSLGYLRRLTLDVLKIDRSFVSELETRIEDQVIVKAIVMLAHAFGLDVTAEGVETPEQLELLRDLGIANAQGYLFSRPRPAADIEACLRAYEA